MDKKDLLLELGCEELPSRYQYSLANTIAELLAKALDGAKLEHGEIHVYATPRRVAVLINDIISTQPSREIERQGPSYANAYDKSGTPTLACLGFARSCGISADQLEVQNMSKGKRVFCRVKQEGKLTIELLPDLINEALKKLQLSKPMRWGNNDFVFVRPVQWVVTLYGREVVHTSLYGKKSSRETQGHRFLYPSKLSISEPRDYNAILYSQGRVIADYKARREMIEKEINKATGANHNAVIDPGLLNEVTALVEWPVALTAEFNPEFLKLPREVLITSMATHLKCFPIEDSQGKLLSQFIVVSNIENDNPKTIINGNENVINARLSDASFFYQNDLKISLEKRLEVLGHVVFEQQLGTMEDKSRRLSKLAAYIAKHGVVNIDIAKHAALLSKCDLISEMVVEFPKLQGIMGYYYALNDKEPKACATAIKEQYLPRFSGDVLPKTLGGTAIALADRLDTLVGILGVNKHPTGDKDPYGLRRAAIGILRILIEKRLPLDLLQLIKQAIKGYGEVLPNKSILEHTFDFVLGRLKSWYQEQGIPVEIFEAVLACRPTAILDFHRRVEAVQKFQAMPEANALASANKRVSNILKKTENTIPKKPDAALFEKQEEKNLAILLKKQQKTVDALYEKADYTKALAELSSLKKPVDAFFDQVMIMDENKKVRLNRLALLASLRHLFSQVADISLLQ